MTMQTKTEVFSLAPTSLAEAMEYANIVAQSEVVPKDYRNKPANVLVAVQMGMEIGLPPIQALQNIAVINGRPSLWGDAVLAIIRTHPEFEGIQESWDDNTKTATCRIKRSGEEWHEEKFSFEDAKLAGLLAKEGPWKQYPKRMAKMRARGFCCRDIFPDALKGLSIREESEDMKEVNPPPVASTPNAAAGKSTKLNKVFEHDMPSPQNADHESSDDVPLVPVPDLITGIRGSQTIDELKSYLPACKMYDEETDEYQKLVSEWNARKTQIEAAQELKKK